ncbi:hypothetical protein [Lysobacter gummosus]
MLFDQADVFWLSDRKASGLKGPPTRSRAKAASKRDQTGQT